LNHGDHPWALATNGSKWQLLGNILAADWLLTGSIWPRAGPQMAAEWQRHGSKWQQGIRRIWGGRSRAGKFRGLHGDMSSGRTSAHLHFLKFIA